MADSPSGSPEAPVPPQRDTPMSTPIEVRPFEFIDRLDDPVSIARAIRDRDRRVLDFRIEYVNLAAAAWAGLPRASMIGQITGELLPHFRARGFFEAMEAVVQTGVPFHRLGATMADPARDSSATGTFDVTAIRLGDGFLATWRRAREAKTPA